eukprot:TRINITY_DN22219_c0_g1_i1.p1 TRINITY_DN22219_c0_g1~~TRINITY_DN22219_c0_g1_i1.p1  ORF type:complete len:446 (-),score=142.49 TRINITY_DN22219_c0_g1_i1:240-1577(-)
MAMSKLYLNKPSIKFGQHLQRNLATSTSSFSKQNVKVLVVGGGAGGAATAHNFSRLLGEGQVTVIEPSTTHFYQPLWTLVGGGIKPLAESAKPMETILPKNATWIQDAVTSFHPEENTVTTKQGQEIGYEYMVVAMGMVSRYEWVNGLEEALDTPGSGVGSNYSHLYVEKTFQELKNFQGGNALFTLPNTPIKCAGAPQKIMYLAEEMFRDLKVEGNVKFFTSLPVLFSVKKYEDVLWDIVKKRDISVSLRHNLVEVRKDAKEAVFENLDTNEKVSVPYNFLHVTPPMSTPESLLQNKHLTDQQGFLDVNSYTLQHKNFSNIFGLGDCINLPPANKTAAAVSVQTGVVKSNLMSVMADSPITSSYNGYSSCPLITSSKTCVLAEFDYFKNPPQPLETFPFNQAKERRLMYHLKADLMPLLYWHGLVKGYWTGPRMLRKLLHAGAD